MFDCSVCRTRSKSLLHHEVLMEDGTSVIFPEIVMEIKDDLIRVADMVGRQEVGRLTQIIQKDVETTIEEFLDALKKQRRKKKLECAGRSIMGTGCRSD